jgi:hypothetical protein
VELAAIEKRGTSLEAEVDAMSFERLVGEIKTVAHTSKLALARKVALGDTPPESASRSEIEEFMWGIYRSRRILRRCADEAWHEYSVRRLFFWTALISEGASREYDEAIEALRSRLMARLDEEATE